ncbi:anaerobic ribonucleoside-triphosphate reductase activating protein [Hyperthermus butylicus]|uniref:Pyruvate-formate lyase-activating enzyme-conserved archaeal protein n=1 Tax=Hyperthermus butylicus (strain DSM 5456 / JCM 9403 / PLM1-5) TaxID=415426 RepID=A2BJ49_HYPBU|nr:anaerobic ribonucleoside-triphosphate reductase activating protein [Hyperthermus butylicus]ABM80010.1 pyruvate-formate lyase-activating enzyme - conserved archaeal protein [Hyperthermus butylicus DSM 5456]
MRDTLLVGGWKAPSLVDVRGRVSFTLWLCGCNLRCPFCHNWKLAEMLPGTCRWAKLDELVEALSGAARLVDVLHVTGGEPLLQPGRLRGLLEASHKLGLGNSINTNCTLPENMEQLLEEKLVDHVATDLKTPFHLLTGLSKSQAARLWGRYLDCLRLLARHGVEVELRIPVPRDIPGYTRLLEESLRQPTEALKGTNWYIVVNPLQGPPAVTPRSPDWCAEHCNPPRTLLEEVAAIAKRYNRKTYTINTPTAGP